jgi:hypothetical protein
VPADNTALPNDVFNECLALRLGVPVTRVEHACGCEHLKISKEPDYIAPTNTPASALQHAHSTLFERLQTTTLGGLLRAHGLEHLGRGLSLSVELILYRA